MNKPQRKSEDTPKKKTLKNVWDYFATVAFVLVGIYYLTIQRLSEGGIYIVVGLFFFVITRIKRKK
jgi:hypothetical protein